MPKRKAAVVQGADKAAIMPSKKAKTKTSGLSASYTTAQKSAIAEFQSVTTTDKNTAAKLLRASNWNVAAAANNFYGNGQGPTGPSSAIRNALIKLFDRYRDSPVDEPDEIGPEGTGNMLEEMSIGLDDIGALVFSELVNSPSLGRVTREGFVDGCGAANADSLSKIQAVVLQRRGQLAADSPLFKKVYNHTFPLALQGGQKSLPPELAAEFWRMLFSPPGLDWRSSSAPWIELWLEFIGGAARKAVNKDLWRQTLVFAEASLRDDSLAFWSEESSWPSVIDEFVEWVKQEKKGGDAMEVA